MKTATNDFHRIGILRRFHLSRVGLLLLTAVIISSILLQDVDSAEIHESPKHRRCSTAVSRRSMNSHSQNTTEIYHPVTPKEIFSRLEATVTFRDNVVDFLGRISLLCLQDDARIPLDTIRIFILNHQIPAYDLLPIGSVLRNLTPKKQLLTLLQMLERVGDSFVSDYAVLLIQAMADGGMASMERMPPFDLLKRIDETVLRSVFNDVRAKRDFPLTRDEAIGFIWNSLKNGTLPLDLKVISALLPHFSFFDSTNPDVPNAVRTLVEYMEKRSKPDDPIFNYIGMSYLDSVEELLLKLLERMEYDESLSLDAREAVSILLQNFNRRFYSDGSIVKQDLKKYLERSLLSRYYYSDRITAVTNYIVNHLNGIKMKDLDIAFPEENTEGLLQVLLRLRKKAASTNLGKALSLLIPFVSQRSRNDVVHEANDETAISFFEVNRYLESFDVPCLPKEVEKAKDRMKLLLSDDLPWVYAFGNKRSSDDPWEVATSALKRLRNIPIEEKQGLAIDDFITEISTRGLTEEKNLLYDYGLIFKREDSSEVELDLYSLLLRIPNVFRDQKFVPMLNFLSKPNILNILGRQFNKFNYRKPRELLLDLLKAAVSVTSMKSDRNLVTALKTARDYLQQPFLINEYSSEELESLLRLLPNIEEDPRYIPLRILFTKEKLFAYLSPTFSIAGQVTPVQRLTAILNTMMLKPTDQQVSTSIEFALNNLEAAVPPRPYHKDDFVYLVRQLFSRDKTLRDEILKNKVYQNIENWNIPLRGTVENILARTLVYSHQRAVKDPKLTALVKRALNVLEAEPMIEAKVLKRKTIENILKHLPDTPYSKPVILLLKKANLMSLVPKLSTKTLEASSPRDALINLLKNLADSPQVKNERLLLRRIRATLRDLEGKPDKTKEHSLLSSYLVQILKDPTNQVFQPLINDLRNLKNVSVSLDDRSQWLQSYLKKFINDTKDENRRKPLKLALQELTYYREETKLRFDEATVKQALSLLPEDPTILPLKKLLTPAWIQSILRGRIQPSNFGDKNHLLKGILREVKNREEILENPILLKSIKNLENILYGWRNNLNPYKKLVTVIKSTVYNPVKGFLTPAILNKLKVSIPLDSNRSPRQLLTTTLHQLILNPHLRENPNIIKLINTVRQDVLAFGVDVDPLIILDDVGVPYTDDFAAIRLFLHRTDTSNTYGSILLDFKNPANRFAKLLQLLGNDLKITDDKRLLSSMEKLGKIRYGIATAQIIEPKGIILSDLFDLIHTIPRRIRNKYPGIGRALNNRVLSSLQNSTSIQLLFRSNDPLIALINEILGLIEVRQDYNLMRQLVSMRNDLRRITRKPAVTGYHLRPLRREIRHVQQVNVDFVRHIFDTDVLGNLNPPESIVDAAMDEAEALGAIVNYLLSEGPASVDREMKRNLMSFKRAFELTYGPTKTKPMFRGLTRREFEEMLSLIPDLKEFTPIKTFMQSTEIRKYIAEDIDWQSFLTASKRLMHLLSLLEEGELGNEVVYESVRKLRETLERKYNFITEREVRAMLRTLIAMRLNDVAPLKIFLNHGNLVRFLPKDFRYSNYGSSAEALSAALEKLLAVPYVKRRAGLREAMEIAKFALDGRPSTLNHYRKSLVGRLVGSEDFSFLRVFRNSSVFNGTLEPPNLLRVLPDDFTFNGRTTFKAKAIHLLKNLQKSRPEVYKELDKILRGVQNYPDVPIITAEDLQPLINILPPKGVSDIDLLKRYLKPTVLTRLLPGTLKIKKTDPRSTLREILLLLKNVLPPTSHKLNTTMNLLIEELAKQKSDLILRRAVIDHYDIKGLIDEIPFKTVDRLKSSQSMFQPTKIISALPPSFTLSRFKTKRLRLIGLLEELSKSKEYKSISDTMSFMKDLISTMPDAPKVNQSDVEDMIVRLLIEQSHKKSLVNNCRIEHLVPYLPITMDISSKETDGQKMSKLLKCCKRAVETITRDGKAKLSISRAEATLKDIPVLQFTREYVDVLIRIIPCKHFPVVKPLLLYMSRNNVGKYIPWEKYIRKKTYKLMILSFLNGMRSIRYLQNDQMLAAIDALVDSAKSLPDKVHLTPNLEKKMYVMPLTIRRAKLNNLLQLVPLRHIAVPPTFSLESEMDNQGFEAALFKIILYTVWYSTYTDSNRPFADEGRQVLKDFKNLGRNRVLSELGKAITNKEAVFKLYYLAHKHHIFDLVADVYKDYYHGGPRRQARVVLGRLDRQNVVRKSTALREELAAILRKLTDGKPVDYEIYRAMEELPEGEKYDGLKMFFYCPEVTSEIYKQNFRPYHTYKYILLEILRIAERHVFDREMRETIKSAREIVKKQQRMEDLKNMLRSQNIHLGRELDGFKEYFLNRGTDEIVKDSAKKRDALKYADPLNRLNYVYSELTSAKNSVPQEIRDEMKYIQAGLKQKLKTNLPRFTEEINLRSLLEALPKTKDEKIIDGLLRFFSIPDLLETLNLKNNPYDYVTKGALLQAIFDKGHELDVVQRDPSMQDALEYFRDKVLLTGTGAKAIELKYRTKNSNRKIDIFGLLRAVDLSKVKENIAVKVFKFFEDKYKDLYYGLGFNQAAHVTRGAYLKGFLQHLVDHTDVPPDMREEIKRLIPAVKLDGRGKEPVDTNYDVDEDVEDPGNITSEALSKDGPLSYGTRRFLKEDLPESLRERTTLLKESVDKILLEIAANENSLEDMENNDIRYSFTVGSSVNSGRTRPSTSNVETRKMLISPGASTVIDYKGDNAKRFLDRISDLTEDKRKREAEKSEKFEIAGVEDGKGTVKKDLSKTVERLLNRKRVDRLVFNGKVRKKVQKKIVVRKAERKPVIMAGGGVYFNDTMRNDDPVGFTRNEATDKSNDRLDLTEKESTDANINSARRKMYVVPRQHHNPREDRSHLKTQAIHYIAGRK